MLQYLFGEGTDTPTAQALAEQRARIEAMQSRQLGTQPANVGEGIRAIGSALVARIGDRRLQPREDAERQRSSDAFNAILAGLGGAPVAPMPTMPPAPPSPPVAPPMADAPPVAASTLPPADLPPQIAAAVDRVAPPAAPVLTEQGMSSMNAPESAFPASLVTTESGGNWNALNNVPGAGGHVGHGGRLQFGTARLQDAANAGVIPPMTAQEFAQQPPEVQQLVEQWHFGDIDNFIRQNGLDQAIGTSINGVPVTLDGMRAVAHLGGTGGLQRFISSGGQYNPADANGTSLLDYLGTHGGGGAMPSGGMTGTMSTMNAPQGGGGNMAIIMQLAELAGNPYLPDGQRMIAQMLIQQQVGQAFAPPMSELDRLQLAQAQLNYDQDLAGLDNGGTVINNNLPGAPEIGTIPQGFEVYIDPNTGQRAMRPIPGGPEDRAPAEVAAAERDATQADVVLTAIEGVREALGKNGMFDILPEAGVWGSRLADMGVNQEAADLRNQLSTIQASVAFDALQAMREASPTGGALGAVSDTEMGLLRSAMGALSQDSSPELLRQSLDDIERVMRKFSQYPDQSGGAEMSDEDLLNLYSE